MNPSATRLIRCNGVKMNEERKVYNSPYGYTNSFHQSYPLDSYPFVMDSRNIDMSRG